MFFISIVSDVFFEKSSNIKTNKKEVKDQNTINQASKQT
jgi:hypothetical protein